MNTKNSMNKYVWAAGIYFGIAGVVMFNAQEIGSIWAIIGSNISAVLLMGILIWTGTVLVQVTNKNEN